MRKVLLTADDGELITGWLPGSWAEVGLQAYAKLAAADTLPDRVRALAALCQLPADPLLEDARHYGAILRAAPWLFGALPEPTAPVPHFTHLGKRYEYLGPLHKINAGQLEALYTFNAAAEGKPLSAGAGLLAVLYCPAGQQQTPEVVRDAAKAMESLPVSVAWPCLVDFGRRRQIGLFGFWQYAQNQDYRQRWRNPYWSVACLMGRGASKSLRRPRRHCPARARPHHGAHGPCLRKPRRLRGPS